MKKVKSLTIILLMVVLLCMLTSNAFAVETITPTGSSNTVAVPTATPAQTTTNVTNTTNTNISNTANTTNTTNSTTNKTNTNTTNTKQSNGLPYAGSDSTIVFIIIGLVVSTIFAYKKVSDYNIK